MEIVEVDIEDKKREDKICLRSLNGENRRLLTDRLPDRTRTETQIKYCILKYVHSPILGESVNVGIFFQFANEIFLKHPSDFDRIKGLYSDFSEWQLKENLVALEAKARKTSDISDVLRKDATVLQLDEIKTVSLYDEPNIVMNDFYNLYFK